MEANKIIWLTGIQRSELNGCCFRLAFTLAGLNDTELAHTSIEAMALMCGLSRSAVMHALYDLSAAGWLSVDSGKRKGRHSIYTLTAYGKPFVLITKESVSIQ